MIHFYTVIHLAFYAVQLVLCSQSMQYVRDQLKRFYSNTQQPELPLGVHPTCSVSIISSDPGVPGWPLASLTLNRTQYVVPGSSGAAWA
jgi:hypothetical protein